MSKLLKYWFNNLLHCKFKSCKVLLDFSWYGCNHPEAINAEPDIFSGSNIPTSAFCLGDDLYLAVLQCYRKNTILNFRICEDYSTPVPAIPCCCLRLRLSVNGDRCNTSISESPRILIIRSATPGPK